MIVRLAWRSLWRNRRRTLITLSSIGLGLAIAIIFASMGAGAYRKMIDQATRLNAGHLTLEDPAYRDAPEPGRVVRDVAAVRARVAALPGVARTKALIVSHGIVSTSSGAGAVTLMGVEPAAERATSPLADKIVAGRYLEDGDARGVVVGARLATRLKLQVGKKLVLTTTDVRGEVVSELLRVTGVFQVGTEELDAGLIHLTVASARRVLGLGEDEATWLGIVLEAAERQEQLREVLAAELAGRGVVVRSWQEVLPELAGWMSLDDRINRIMRGVILFLVAFTVLNTILMSVLERGREFALLMALGTSERRVRQQVFWESTLLALLGCAAGLVLGVGVSWYFQAHGLDLSAAFDEGPNIAGFSVDPVLHFHVASGDVAVMTAIVFGATVMIGLYPMLRATRIPVAQLLRAR